MRDNFPKLAAILPVLTIKILVMITNDKIKHYLGNIVFDAICRADKAQLVSMSAMVKQDIEMIEKGYIKGANDILFKRKMELILIDRMQGN